MVEAMGMHSLLTLINHLGEQALTELVVVHTFLHRWILPLRERVHPLWRHHGIINP